MLTTFTRRWDSISTTLCPSLPFPRAATFPSVPNIVDSHCQNRPVQGTPPQTDPRRPLPTRLPPWRRTRRHQKGCFHPRPRRPLLDMSSNVGHNELHLQRIPSSPRHVSTRCTSFQTFSPPSSPLSTSVWFPRKHRRRMLFFVREQRESWCQSKWESS